jgi:hypothetical protein
MGAAADLTLSEHGEPAFDLISPRGRGRGEVHVKAWIACGPAFNGMASSEFPVESLRTACRDARFTGGDDVPSDKLKTRSPRISANLRNALREVPHVWIFDNDDLRHPYWVVAVYENGNPVRWHKPIPRWLATALDQ